MGIFKFFDISLLCFVLLLSACQHLPIHNFDKVQTGMDKDQVLDLIGSPQYVERKSGKDRWLYEFHQGHEKTEKELVFSGGNLIYIGDKIKPEVSAEEQDTINKVQNEQLAKKEQEQRQKHKNSFQQYEEKVQGKSEIQYLPKFEPIQ